MRDAGRRRRRRGADRARGRARRLGLAADARRGQLPAGSRGVRLHQRRRERRPGRRNDPAGHLGRAPGAGVQSRAPPKSRCCRARASSPGVNAASGWGQGETVTVPVARAAQTVRDARICTTVGPSFEPLRVDGPRTASSSPAQHLAGHVLLRIEYLRPGPKSWLALAPSIARHLSLGRAPRVCGSCSCCWRWSLRWSRSQRGSRSGSCGEQAHRHQAAAVRPRACARALARLWSASVQPTRRARPQAGGPQTRAAPPACRHTVVPSARGAREDPTGSPDVRARRVPERRLLVDRHATVPTCRTSRRTSPTRRNWRKQRACRRDRAVPILAAGDRGPRATCATSRSVSTRRRARSPRRPSSGSWSGT